MSELASGAAHQGSEDRSFFGHPKGLAILFFTEMWERFSYYGMRGLLILYLTQHFLFSDERSNLIYGAYISLVYIMTIIGGTLADRYLGQRKAVTFGAILLVLGHGLMAFEGSGSQEILTFQGEAYELTRDGRGGDAQAIIVSGDVSSAITYEDGGTILRIADPAALGLPSEIDLSQTETRVEKQDLYVNILYLALALIIAGVGFLKANISTIVGELYVKGDPKRDSGFTLFYMGINLGSLLSYLTIAWIGIVYGWAYGFGLAGIGMVFGLLTFLGFQHWLEGKADPPDAEKLRKRVFGPLTIEHMCYLTGLGIIAVAMTAVMNPQYMGGILGPLGLAMLAFMIGYAVIYCKGEERGQMIAATYFIVAQIPFWALFEQAGGSLNLFTDRFVDRSVFGLQVPAPVFQAINPFFIITLAPILAWAWLALAKRKLNPSTPIKFALGVFMAGLGFYVLVGGITLSGAALVSVYFIFLIYLIHTIGELLLSPVGLSAVTKLAPARVVGMTMGAWFLFSGLSNFLSGIIGAATGAETIGGQLTDPETAKAAYAAVYSNVGLTAMGIAVVMLLLAPFIKKLMGSAAQDIVPHPTETEAGQQSMDRTSGAR